MKGGVGVGKAKPGTLAALAVLLTLTTFLYSPVHALSWSSPVILEYNPWTYLSPDIIQTSNGEAWVVWQMRPLQEDNDIYLDKWNQYGWSGSIPMTDHPSQDITPAITQLQNGTILLVWSSNRGTDYDLYLKRYNGLNASPESLLVTAPGNDLGPELVTRSNGEVWLVWSSNNDLYYMTFNGRNWSQRTPLVTESHRDIVPSIEETKDGKVRVVWESDRLAAGVGAIYYKTYDGTSWTPDTPIAVNPTSGNSNKAPEIFQDRDGLLWVFFSQERSTGTPSNPYQFDIAYITSSNGVNWSAQTVLRTTLPTDNNSNNEQYPAAADGPGKRIWLVWTSDESNPYGTEVIHLSKSDVINTHDVGISQLTRSINNPRLAEPFTVTVSVKNYGDFTETITLTVMMNSTLIGSQTFSINASQTRSFNFNWNTASLTQARYVMTTTVTRVTNETTANAADNSRQASLMLVPRGDANRDGVVNILDLTFVGASIGTTVGDPAYNSEADLNRDGSVNILDLTIVALDFGKSV